MTEVVSRLESATFVYRSGSRTVTAVDRAKFSVTRGDMVGVVGPSGSGKTTLMNMLGTLQLPTTGDAYFAEKRVAGLTPSERRGLGLQNIGFVFQQLRLFQNLSALENVMLPLVLSRFPPALRRERAEELIDSVGLAGKETRRPGQLSVGEQQRVAVARALVNEPRLVLADEPTSQLDSSSGQEILRGLESLCKKIDAAIVVSTHDQRIMDGLGRVYEMRDGVLTPR